VPATTYGSLSAAQYTGQANVTLSAGDIISLRNTSSGDVTLLRSLGPLGLTSINASLLLVRLQ
jgi:hypothetical protein